jgi:pyridoxine 4-dehydrogenase
MVAASQSTIMIGAKPVSRLGFGTLKLLGPGAWGPPPDPDGARGVLRRAVELGVQLIDTADSYGPYIAEELVASALHPYSDDLVIATKGGVLRPRPGLGLGTGHWGVCGRPDYLRQCIEMSLRRLNVETIDLYQLHRIDPDVPLAEQIGALVEAKEAGKIRLIGLSEVTLAQFTEARRYGQVASVQNRYNARDWNDPSSDNNAILRICDIEGTPFFPWEPLVSFKLTSPSARERLASMTADLDVTPSQLALAWFLHRSPSLVPIPGTSSSAHVAENMRAVDIPLTDDVVGEIAKLGLTEPPG